MLKNERKEYLELLSEKYPTKQSILTEIINLSAILNLPKGTEHFMSDIHGEYDAFLHILNNCSGIIWEKACIVFDDRLSEVDISDLCTLIYYPVQKLKILKSNGKVNAFFYKRILLQLIELTKYISSKYTRSKVKKAMSPDFAYIIDELLHAQPDDKQSSQDGYHEKIIETIIDLNNAESFIIELCSLIKCLAVDKLHIVGDIYDRGANADKIVNLLMDHHDLDIEWGNHEIIWMGAACGNDACIASVVRNNIKYENLNILERGYGISLRQLILFAEKYYHTDNLYKSAFRAISIIMFKLESRIIKRHPEYEMDGSLYLDKINYDKFTVEIDGQSYPLDRSFFPTVDPQDPYKLTDEEIKVIDDLKDAFLSSESLQKHIDFLYEYGSVYKVYNQNLLYHGCIPLDENGVFEKVMIGDQYYHGKNFLDAADKKIRRAYLKRQEDDIDFMWFLWGANKSPLCGRTLRTFERMFFKDENLWKEPQNSYYNFCNHEQTCTMILNEFGLYSPWSHIINGHTPIKEIQGESPIKANGKLIVIDGGFCSAYQPATGIAGYTLIFNSHGMRIKSHTAFDGIDKVLSENFDIESTSQIFETAEKRIMVADTDNGSLMKKSIEDLKELLYYYDDLDR